MKFWARRNIHLTCFLRENISRGTLTVNNIVLHQKDQVILFERVLQEVPNYIYIYSGAEKPKKKKGHEQIAQEG